MRIQRAMDTPGPGAYENHRTGNRPSWKLGKSTRDSKGILGQSHSTPGPGTYEMKGKDCAPKWGFGDLKRRELMDNGVPGPGQYEMLPMIGN